ncbi:YhgE/Pip family protein [Microbacteriaceae bacterium 4G12]
MRRFTTLKTEFTAIFQKKMMLAALIAIMFVPVLYAGTYLYAFKDPYGKLKDLPVAVVNLDKGATHDGKELTIGKDFVKKLKDKEDFQWHFVSDKEANKGLADNKYYMVIRIPENFSENATTLTDDHPKRLVMDYIPNKGYNFLASQISSSAVEKIKEEISSTITETYAEDMFDSVKKVSDGFVKASDGAHQINDGQTTAKDGSSQITNGLNQFVDPKGEFQTGLGKLQGGLGDLVNPTGKLQVNLGRLKDGSNDLAGGLGEFATKTNAGLNQLVGGMNELSQKTNTGLGQLSKGSNDLAGGLSQLVDPKGEFQTGLGGIQKGSKDLANGVKASADGVTKMQAQVPELTKGSAGLNAGLNGVSTGLTAWKKGADGATTEAQKVAADLEKLNAQLDQLSNQDKSNLKQLVSELIEENKKVVGTTAALSEKAGGISDSAVELSKGADRLHQGQVKLEKGIGELKDGQDGLVAGSTKLASGVEELATKTNTGLDRLSKGSNDLAGGLGQLVNPKGEFQAGLGKLQGGLGQLVNPKEEFQVGLGQLSKGSKDLAGGLGQLVNPKEEFQVGLNQLSGGMGELSTKATDGLNQLDKGSIDLTDGLVKLQDGSKELADQLHDGAVDTGKVKGDNDKYTMFAKPVKVNTEDFGKVENYGTGVAPYFLSLGLYVGALLLSVIYPLRESAGIPKSGFNWFLSKYAVILIMGVVQSIIIDCVVLYGLDFKVQSVPQFMLFTIVTSIAFLSLIQFLVTTLGDVGRFIAIVILVLQLTTSAGTYPIEMVNNALQMFSPLVPMTYSVAGFKAVFASGDYTFMWHNGFYLIGLTVLCAIGTTMCLTVLYKRYFGRVAKETSAEA